MTAMPAASAGAAGLSPATLWLVFLTGLVGGFGHCLGMCGPIVAAFGFGDGSLVGVSGDPTSRVGAALRPIGLFQVGYQAGRTATYTIIGALLGALGSAGVLGALPGGMVTGVQRWLFVGAGILMIVMGLALAGVPGLSSLVRWIESSATTGASGGISAGIRGLAKGGALSAVPLGMLMGLIPCGFLMTIEVQALAAGSALAGATIMFVFALGTVPALAVFGMASGLIGARARGWLTKAGAVLVIILGLLTLARASGLAMNMAQHVAR